MPGGFCTTTKNFFLCFLDKIYFQNHYRTQGLCRVSLALGKGLNTLGKAFVECHTRQSTRQISSRQRGLCRVFFIRHSWHSTKMKMKKPEKIGIFLWGEGCRWLAPAFFFTAFFAQNLQLSSGWDSNLWPLSHAPLSLTTTPHHHLCLCCVSVPRILYQIQCKLIIWAPK